MEIQPIMAMQPIKEATMPVTGETPLVSVIMGSMSDWEAMRHASETLDALGIPHEVRVLSAHRTPDETLAYASEAAGRGMRVLIAGAGGAAHLPGIIAAKTPLPVIGVPMQSALQGLDSMLSIAQMPGGVPVATMAIGRAGAVNAALYAARILALSDTDVATRLREYVEARRQSVLAQSDPREEIGSNGPVTVGCT